MNNPQVFGQNSPAKNNITAENGALKSSSGLNISPKTLPILLYGGLSLFILVVFAIALACKGVYPFGDATMSSYDMSAQVAPFIEHFFDVINGKSSLFYSFSIAGGADVFGTLAYCCVSPFTFIFLLFGEGNVYYGTAIVLPLKIVCVAISGLYYVRKRFSTIHPLVQVILALSYAYCGYLFVANTYINWVDLLIYLPFVALGFYQLVNTGKKRTFVISLALMIYTCFSITCFSLLLIFPIIVLYCIFVESAENRKKVLSNAIWGLVLAIAVALPILIPALRAFLVSGRKTGIFDNINAKYSYEALYKKVSYLFTDSLTVFFTLVYFVKYGVKRAKDKFLAIVGAFLLIPIFVDESMNLLNFGSYMSYSLRFGFLNGFYFFYIACSFFDEYVKEGKPNSFVEIKKPHNALFGGLLGIACVAFWVGLVIFNNVLEGESFVKWFSSRFAHSEGGLEATAIIFGCVALIALLGLFLVYYKKISVKIFVPALALLLCGQTVFYTVNLVDGNYYKPTSFEQIKILTDYVEEVEGNDETRIKMNGDYLTACMPFTLHTNSYSVFSSVIDSRNFVPTTFFGYSGNGKNSMKSYGGKPMGDVIFGNKYVIADGSYYRSYLQKIDDERLKIDKDGNPIDIGNYVLYKHKYALPHAFAVQNAKTEEVGIAGDYDSIFKMLGGENCGIKWTGFTIDKMKNDEGVYRVRTSVIGAGSYFMVTNFENVNEIRYTRSSYVEEDAKNLVGNEEISLGYSTSSSGAFSVYFKCSNPEKPLTEEILKNSCKIFFAPDETLEQIYKMAIAQNVQFETNPNEISVKIMANEGDYLFLNYVALPGHVAIVNGKEKALETNTLGFMLVELGAGENDVQIIYKSPYKSLIAIGIALGAVIIAVYYLIKVKFKKFMAWLEKPLFWAGIAVAVCVVAFFFAMPICVCLFKNVKLLIETVGNFISGL